MGLVLLLVVEMLQNLVRVKAVIGPHVLIPGMVFTQYIQSTVP